MTRTERAAYPRAIVKDRAESKSGMNKHIPKNGAGLHNWGALMSERDYEDAAEYDEEREFEDAGVNRCRSPPASPVVEHRTNSLTEEDIVNARRYRKRAMSRTDVDLNSIARTSAAVSISPPNRTIPIISDADTSTISFESSV
ncbi:hypothetical protein AcV5_001264 [Taiwanofungus camphoratus]|nr:hypothetical protein AcV5_001264 [Antrodia cinnamomea]